MGRAEGVLTAAGASDNPQGWGDLSPGQDEPGGAGPPVIIRPLYIDDTEALFGKSPARPPVPPQWGANRGPPPPHNLRHDLRVCIFRGKGLPDTDMQRERINGILAVLSPLAAYSRRSQSAAGGERRGSCCSVASWRLRVASAGPLSASPAVHCR